MTQQVAKVAIHDETSDRRYFTTVPNIVDDLTESPLDAAVYRAMLRCAGGMGKTCFASTRRIAEIAKVSPGQVSNSKKALSELGFIVFGGKHPVGDSGQPLDHYALPDLWPRNMHHFSEIEKRSPHEHLERSPHEQERSPHERKRSPHETKKGSSRKEVSERKSCALKLSDRAQAHLDYLNSRTNRSGASLFTSWGGLRERLKAGATDDDVRVVMDFKIAEWGNDEKMRRFIRPTTLFGPEKFPGYLSDARDWEARGRPSFNGGAEKRYGTERGVEYYVKREAE